MDKTQEFWVRYYELESDLKAAQQRIQDLEAALEDVLVLLKEQDALYEDAMKKQGSSRGSMGEKLIATIAVVEQALKGNSS